MSENNIILADTARLLTKETFSNKLSAAIDKFKSIDAPQEIQRAIDNGNYTAYVDCPSIITIERFKTYLQPLLTELGYTSDHSSAAMRGADYGNFIAITWDPNYKQNTNDDESK